MIGLLHEQIMNHTQVDLTVLPRNVREVADALVRGRTRVVEIVVWNEDPIEEITVIIVDLRSA